MAQPESVARRIRDAPEAQRGAWTGDACEWEDAAAAQSCASIKLEI